MRPDQRTKLAVGIYAIFAGLFPVVDEIQAEDEQQYTYILEEIEQYISEKIG